ncbi:MAG: DNA circularization N-terminal domain-containing protein [Tagaea sp.]|nr:DNA circularization N-terminal domain-containing protein [Tagaea sp.]
MTSSLASSLKQGSFRGVVFDCAIDLDEELGRRYAVHEYPQRDEAFAEDLGKKNAPFTITAKIVGPDWLERSERLRQAVEEPGPGELVHPWHGVRRVVCLGPKRSYSAGETGAAKFTLSFMDAGANLHPSATADTGMRARESADATIGPARIDFARRVETRRQSSVVRERLRTSLDGLRRDAARGLAPAFGDTGGDGNLDIARDVFGMGDDALGFAEGATSGVRYAGRGGLAGAASLLMGGYSDLVDAPSSLASRTMSLARLLAFGHADPARGTRAVRGWNESGASYRSWSQGNDIAWTGESWAVAPTPSRAASVNNEIALGELMDRAALSAEVARSTDRDFASREEALAYRADLDARLASAATRAADLGDDDSHRAMIDLRADSSAHLAEKAGTLARAAEYVPPATRPSLVVAWQVYGDDPDKVVERASEVSARNGFRHPGFVRGGRPVEVLLDG